jgi:anthranilate synthase component 2
MPGLHVVLLDNRDSFVWNLAQALGTLGARISVLRSDRVGVDAIRAAAPDALVISPGPGRPEDAGCSVAAVRQLGPTLPVLGVCLGHQAIGLAFGARIDRCPPCHGKAWRIEHRGTGLFRGLPQPMTAARYHSLCVAADSLPDGLSAEAWTGDGLLMSIQHRSWPVFGLQFHPESFRTEAGLDLLRNFLEVAS